MAPRTRRDSQLSGIDAKFPIRAKPRLPEGAQTVIGALFGFGRPSHRFPRVVPTSHLHLTTQKEVSERVSGGRENVLSVIPIG